MRKFFPPRVNNNLKGIGLIFYCKDCEKVVDVIPFGRKFVYKCAICKTKNVAFGTDKSIRNFFRLPEDKSVPAAEVAPVTPAAKVEKTESAGQIPAAEVPSPPPADSAAPADLKSEPTPIPENK